MNIFFLDFDPKKCAEYHVDKHSIKMCVEYAQLMSTAHRVLDGTPKSIYKTRLPKLNLKALTNDIDLKNDFKIPKIRQVTEYEHPNTELYKATHINHPSAIWARSSKSNYDWLYQLWKNLLDEYTYRYDKVHSSSRLLSDLILTPNNINTGQFTEPTPAMPDLYKVSGSNLESYRKYYRLGKKELHSWDGKVYGRSIPYWI